MVARWQCRTAREPRCRTAREPQCRTAREPRHRTAREPRHGGRTLTRVLSPSPVIEVAGARCVVDYALARRAVLTGLASGRIRAEDACDAHIYLRRAAKYHGEPTDQICPVCQAEPLIHVTYAFGECFPNGANGRARPTREVCELAAELPEFSVFVVEVCLGCHWNHLVTSAVLGTGAPVQGRRRSGANADRRAPAGV